MEGGGRPRTSMSFFRQSCQCPRVSVEACTRTSTAATGPSSPRTPASTGGSSPPCSPRKIYCRPSCPVRPPFARNVRFYPTAAAAQQAGFRALQALPARRLAGLARVERPRRRRGQGHAAHRRRHRRPRRRDGLGGPRRLHALDNSSGCCRPRSAPIPLALARAQRTQTARVLIETTDLPFGDVAFAAGFSSIRQFNDTVRAVCALTPTALRERPRNKFGPSQSTGSGVLSLRLPVRTPFAYEGLFGHLAATAVPGVEEVRDGAYRRTLRLASGNGIVSLTPRPDHVRCELVLDDFRDLSTAIARCSRLLDLDADPEAVVDVLSADPSARRTGGEGPGPADSAHRRRSRAGPAGGDRSAGVGEGRAHPRSAPRRGVRIAASRRGTAL